MSYFAGCTTPEQRKARFRELAKKYHPDIGGDEAIMKAINREYEDLEKGRGASNTAFDDLFKRAEKSREAQSENIRKGHEDVAERIRRAFARANRREESDHMRDSAFYSHQSFFESLQQEARLRAQMEEERRRQADAANYKANFDRTFHGNTTTNSSSRGFRASPDAKLNEFLNSIGFERSIHRDGFNLVVRGELFIDGRWVLQAGGRENLETLKAALVGRLRDLQASISRDIDKKIYELRNTSTR